jgi:GcrA cell cycle regulator
MSWTEERVERLTSLWLDGRSASQIAAELGDGVSRNAVIGKVHRLGLSGRAVPPAAPCPPRDAAPEGAPTLTEHTLDDVAAVLEAAPEPIKIDLPALRAAQGSALPVTHRVTLLELSGSMCRWPIGDPTNAEFRFCGCRALAPFPYCQDHARLAFQPVADRRRAERSLIRLA